MSKSSSPICTRCGAPIPAGVVDQLCPACLMSGAMAPHGVNTETGLMGSGDSRLRSGRTAAPEPTQFPYEFGGYRLRGLLGRGGMGTVYEAEQLATGRRVALKMLGQQLDSPEMRQRFLREGRLAASVSHENSLYVFGSEEIEGAPVITMEIAGSGTLKDKLRKRGPLPVTEAVDAILDAIAGLEAAFAVGVLHRDIKPSNCFVNPDGSVKVGDFGLSVSTLSKDDSYVTAAGVIMGTPAYAPPEQLRGDNLDVRADIYSVGATLFTLLTGQAPFEGENAVQVVANAVNQKPKPLTQVRKDVPPGLERVVDRCLAKEPEGRYADYTALRNALLPFSSKEPEPASIKVRTSAGWIDFLIAFLVPYVTLMISVGGEELLILPLVERTLYSARYYIAIFCFAFLYFGISEGIWGAGLGKWLKGLRVVGANGQPPGIGRALVRILIPILCIEGVRMPLMMASISDVNLTGLQIALFVIVANVCAWIPVLMTLSARRENGFATIWDLASCTRVVVRPKGVPRPSIQGAAQSGLPAEGGDTIGPYQVIEELVPGEWIVATDPVLRRQVWLLRRHAPELSPARQNLARSGRLRWLQKTETTEATWDAFEANQGVPFSSLVEGGNLLPWSNLRHWLHDLASELWEATRDKTQLAELSLDHIWITTHGHAVLLDEPWPHAKTSAECIPVGNINGQQRFLNAVAACVESTSLPLHARPVLRNLGHGKFEKLSFLTGTLRGLLDKPTEVSKAIRAGSIFMLPLYVWILVFLGAYQPGNAQPWCETLSGFIVVTIVVVLGVIALFQLLGLPLHSAASHAIFGIAVVNAKGERASVSTLFVRWAIVWLPLFVSMLFIAQLRNTAEGIAFISAVVLLMLWVGAAVYAVIHPNRGLHDRLAGTWLVRR